MRKMGRSGLFAGAVMAAGIVLAASGPASAQVALSAEKFAFGGFVPVLFGNGGAFCGPCEPGPTVIHGAPNAAVVVSRYHWSPAERQFQLVETGEAGVTDLQGDLRFTVPNGKYGLDKLVVSVGDVRSNAILFLTNGACGGPRLCPLPFHMTALTHASSFLPEQPVIVTVTGAERGSVLEIAQEEYVADGDREEWIPTGEVAAAEVDVFGRATVTLHAPGPGVYRAIARNPASGDESSLALYEVVGRGR